MLVSKTFRLVYDLIKSEYKLFMRLKATISMRRSDTTPAVVGEFNLMNGHEWEPNEDFLLGRNIDVELFSYDFWRDWETAVLHWTKVHKKDILEIGIDSSHYDLSLHYMRRKMHT